MSLPKGLKNEGNTCFLNAVIQCLASLSSLVKFFNNEERTTCHFNNQSTKQGCVYSAFIEMVKSISSGQCLSSHNFLNLLKSFWPEYFFGQQMDAFLCIQNLLDWLHEDMLTDCGELPGSTNYFWAQWLSTENSFVRDNFHIMPLLSRACQDCGNHEIQVEPPVSSISLSLPDCPQTSLQECLMSYLSPFAVEISCSLCQSNRMAMKTDLCRMPQVLIIHFKRYAWSNEGSKKLQNKVFYPEQFQPSAYCEDILSDDQYELKGAVIHRGSDISSGHYVAVCKRASNWYLFDDSEVTVCEKPDPVRGDVYILLYEKACSDPVTDVHPVKTLEIPQGTSAQPIADNLKKKTAGKSSIVQKPRREVYDSLQPLRTSTILPGTAAQRNTDKLRKETAGKSLLAQKQCRKGYDMQTFEIPPRTAAQPNNENFGVKTTDDSLFVQKKCMEGYDSQEKLGSSNAQKGTFHRKGKRPQKVTQAKKQRVTKKAKYPSLAECISIYDSMPEEAKKLCCRDLTLHYVDPILTEDDVEGAKLDISCLPKYTVSQLKRWLVTRKLNAAGNKDELITKITNHVKRGKGGFIDPGVDGGIWHQKKLQEVRKSYEDKVPSNLRPPHVPITTWRKFPSIDVPQYLNLGQAIHYLVERVPRVGSNLEEEDEQDDGSDCNVMSDDERSSSNLRGVHNPFIRGQRYLDGDAMIKIEDTTFQNHYFVRAQVQASYESNVHIVIITVSRQSGSICIAHCDCKQSALGRCCHVSAVLLDICGQIAQDDVEEEEGTTTTRPQYWGKGGKRRHPGVFKERQYWKKFDVERRGGFDPTPTFFKSTDIGCALRELVKDIKVGNPNKNIMLLSLFDTRENRQYEGNSTVENNPSQPELEQISEEWIRSEEPNFSRVDEEPEITEECVTAKCLAFLEFLKDQFKERGPCEISGTKDQHNSDMWKKERSFRATASTARRISGLLSPRSTSQGKINFLREHVWNITAEENHDFISRKQQAFMYGIDNEPTARRDYAEELVRSSPDLEVIETGMWINAACPQLSCSPDGLVKRDGKVVKILEIKCPVTLRDCHPKDFDTWLDIKQVKSHFLKRDEDGSISLRTTSQYYYQVQQNMDVLEVEECDFVVWSPKGKIVLSICYDKEFWSVKKKKIVETHRRLILPEYFSKRALRKLSPYILSY